MILLDTTILVYAVGGEHTLREPCQRLIEAIEQQHLRATTSAEVLQEFVHVRARRRGREDAARLAHAWLALLTPLVPQDDETIRRGLEVFGSCPDLGSFDAALAGVALHHSATLVSADRAFSTVEGLFVVSPASADFARVIGLT